MKRRQFIKTTALGTLAGFSTAVSTAQANTNPKLHWRLTTSFSKNIDILYNSTVQFAERVAQLSEGQFAIQVFAAGEIVPANQVFDAIQHGTVEIGHTASYYYHGKNKALSIDTALPFGLTQRMQNAWLYKGGGLELMRELFAKYNIVNFPGGNTGTQMGGWFRKEVNTLEDLKGLKFRIPGFGGEILARLGVIPQNIPATDVYSALEKGTIDAVEFVGPYDDAKLGLQTVAPYYYYPGFWEGSASISYYINKEKWESLPEHYQKILDIAAKEASVLLTASYDSENPMALATLVQNGAKLRPFSREILEASYAEAQKIYAEEAAKNPDFDKIYRHWQGFHNQEYQWFSLNEARFQNFMFAQAQKAKSNK